MRQGTTIIRHYQYPIRSLHVFALNIVFIKKEEKYKIKQPKLYIRHILAANKSNELRKFMSVPLLVNMPVNDWEKAQEWAT